MKHKSILIFLSLSLRWRDMCVWYSYYGEKGKELKFEPFMHQRMKAVKESSQEQDQWSNYCSS